ncbi:MAG: flagellar assembly protein FliH [Spirochaetes bacterium]|nr:flagellar assembly protein FliH [Spirochaetota bacterium]
MPKAVFRPQELTILSETVDIEVPVEYAELSSSISLSNEESLEELDILDEYTGPSIEDLRREAEEFKQQLEEERQAMIEDANFMAENLIRKAEEEVAREVERKNAEAMTIVNHAHEEADKIIAAAQAKAAEIEKEMRQNLDIQQKEALDLGKESGHREGYAEGKTEVERLIERARTVLERAQDKRADILVQSEQEIVDLVLLLARKVIKIISETQKSVIVSNVIQALRKIRTKGDIIVRVNLTDLKLTTEHTRDFIQLVEGAKSIQVIEDSSVGPGGCIIETDFGEIDARISSQLAELEDKILEISPIKSRIKSPKGSEADAAGGLPDDSLKGLSLKEGLSKTDDDLPEDEFAESVLADGDLKSSVLSNGGEKVEEEDPFVAFSLMADKDENA